MQDHPPGPWGVTERGYAADKALSSVCCRTRMPVEGARGVRRSAGRDGRPRQAAMGACASDEGT